jgi:hypothetical protein
LLGSFALLRETGGRRPGLRVGLAGFLAAYASVVELQVAPVSAVLGVYLVAQVVGRVRRPAALGQYFVGALGPTLVLLGYNFVAFGSPFDMGYFHHATRIFADVHNKDNPLGLVVPDLSRIPPLLVGRYRGLLFYAPVVAVVPIGLVSLGKHGRWGVAVVAAAAMSAVFLVNLSYPEWTGGWSTGPRLLVTLLPFAMLPVAAWLGDGGKVAVWTVGALGVCGAALMLLFVGVGGRIPQYYPDPLFDPVWSLWQGRDVPGWVGARFARTAVAWLSPGLIAHLPERLRWLQFVPLVAVQALGVAGMCWAVRGDRGKDGSAATK